MSKHHVYVLMIHFTIATISYYGCINVYYIVMSFEVYTEYLANWLVITVGVTLIWRKAVPAIHIIAIKLY